MRIVRVIAMLALAAMAFAAFTGSASAAQRPGVELQTALHGSAMFPNADGKARFRDRGGEQELEVEVEDAHALAGTTVRVFVNGNRVGTIRLTRFGNGQLNLNRDQGETVPAVKTGTTVRVRTAAGALVVSGSF